MGQTTLGTKIALINTFALYPLTLYTKNAAGAPTYESKTTDPAAADAAVLEGYGRIELDTLSRHLRVVKPRHATKHKITVAPGQLTLGTIANGDVVTFKLRLTTDDARAEFDSRDSREHRTFRFEVRLRANDTTATILKKLYDQIALVKNLFPEADGAGEPFEVTFDGATNTLTVEAADAQITIDLGVDDLGYESTDLVPTFAFTEVSPQFAGRGTYLQLKNVIRQTDGSNEIDGLSQGRDLPNSRALYTEISFGTLTDRPDLSGGGAAGDVVAQKPEWVIFVAETADNDGDLDKLVTFLAKSTGTKEFVGAVDADDTAPELIAEAVPVVAEDDVKIAPRRR